MTLLRLRSTLGAATLCVAALLAPIASLAPSQADAKDWKTISSEPKRGEALVVHLGKVVTLELDRPAADILISDPKIVQATLRTARQPVLYGMRLGQANILFFDQSNNQFRSIEVRVEHDVALLNRTIRRQFPKARVRARSVMGEVILDGVTQSSHSAKGVLNLAQRFVAAARASQSGDGAARAIDKEATGVVNRISIANEEQIHLRVRVAEVNRTVLKELGVDWNSALQNSTLSSTLTFTSGGLTGFLEASGSQIVVGPQALSSFLKALEQNSLVSTLAEPSLTAISGETASFLAGGEYPIPVATTDGVTVDFKSFGVGLDFTPVVLENGRISLKVKTEVSDLTTTGAVTLNGVEVPALTIRRAESTVELPSGGTMLIGGLIQQSTRRLSAGLPGVRDIPVIGQFFRSESNQIDETELVILVTPYAVRPNTPRAFKSPTDGFKPASDVDMYLFGRLHAVYGAGPEDLARVRAQAKRMPGAIGFILE